MQDRPTAAELLDSVAEYLFSELRPEVPREQRFKVLVAANVCAVVAREIRAGEGPDREDLALFGELLGKEVDDPRAAAAELSSGSARVSSMTGSTSLRPASRSTSAASSRWRAPGTRIRQASNRRGRYPARPLVEARYRWPVNACERSRATPEMKGESP